MSFYESIDDYVVKRIEFLQSIENAGGRECLSNSRYRRSGRSTRIMLETLKQMSLHPGSRVYIFGKTYNNAKSFKDRLMESAGLFNIPYGVIITQQVGGKYIKNSYTASEMKNLSINGLIEFHDESIYVYDHTCFE